MKLENLYAMSSWDSQHPTAQVARALGSFLEENGYEVGFISPGKFIAEKDGTIYGTYCYSPTHSITASHPDSTRNNDYLSVDFRDPDSFDKVLEFFENYEA